MKIDDLLTLHADSQLSSFSWGNRLVDIVNFHGDGVHRLHVDMTGLEARQSMRSMSPVKLMRLFVLDFDIESGDVSYAGETSVTESQSSESVTFDRSEDKKFNRKIVIWAAVILTLFTVVIVTVMSLVSVTTGELQGTDSVAGILSVFVDLLKTVLGSD